MAFLYGWEKILWRCRKAGALYACAGGNKRIGKPRRGGKIEMGKTRKQVFARKPAPPRAAIGFLEQKSFAALGGIPIMKAMYRNVLAF